MSELGDQPIESRQREVMNNLGRLLGRAINGNETDVTKHTWGFVLMVFPLDDHEGRCNYISSGRREDVIVLLKEQLRRFEGAPDVTGSA